jgi:hypothetical protein
MAIALEIAQNASRVRIAVQRPFIRENSQRTEAIATQHASQGADRLRQPNVLSFLPPVVGAVREITVNSIQDRNGDGFDY